MDEIEQQLDRILIFLRSAIHDSGMTQLEVQEQLKWGRSYISQLVTKQKNLRVDQLLDILNITGVEPGDFWREVYQGYGAEKADISRPSQGRRETEASNATVQGLCRLLVEKQIISEDELLEVVSGPP